MVSTECILRHAICIQYALYNGVQEIQNLSPFASRNVQLRFLQELATGTGSTTPFCS